MAKVKTAAAAAAAVTAQPVNTVESTAKAFSEQLYTSTAVHDNNKRTTGISLCSFIRAMSCKGFNGNLIGAMLSIANVPCSKATVTAQAGAASGLKPGDISVHGPVPAYDEYPASLRNAIEAFATAIATTMTVADINAAKKALAGKRASMTPTMMLPAALRS